MMLRLTFLTLALNLMASSLFSGPLVGLQSIDEPLPWFDPAPNYAAYDPDTQELEPARVAAVTSLERKPLERPIEVTLSRSVYPAEDNHVDAIVRLKRPKGGLLKVDLLDEKGTPVCHAEERLDKKCDQLFFSYRFPEHFAGRGGALHVSLGGHEAKAHFRVAPASKIATEGRVFIEIPNPNGITLQGAPFSVGVPFPAGALNSVEHLRLVDEAGRELSLQARETGRWSRFGSIRWLLCDFTLDLAGTPRKLFLEYGPTIRPKRCPSIAVTPSGGFPEVDAGWLQIGAQGIRFRGSEALLPVESLTGAFVEGVEGLQFTGWGHPYVAEDEAVYRMDPAAPFIIEESGPEKIVVRTEGDYLQPGEDGKRFCRYLVRYEIFRDSPLIRLLHTWVYTGDGNRQPIRSMGWRLPFSAAKPSGFLTEFGDQGEWVEERYLRQEHYDHHTRFSLSVPQPRSPLRREFKPARPLVESGRGGRAPGIMAAEGAGTSVTFGVKSFWQNFPSSLMQEPEAMTFYQWPKHGAPRTHGFKEGDDIWRLWFAHEGEVLSFRLPIELTEGSIYRAEAAVEPHYAYGQPDSINAQGIAKTAEMWLLFDPDRNRAARALQALNNGTLRAVVDPAWIMQSGVYPAMSARDDAFPDDERVYELNVRKPMLQVERMGLYGKWIYGDLLRAADLEAQTASLYRTFRKAHWGWPYSWLPYARSGDLRLYPFAEAATRMMSDIAFCHYVSDDVAQQFNMMPPRRLWKRSRPFRAIGWHNRNLIPWAGYWGPSTRLYVDKADYLWQAYYLTGYSRARDVALLWAEQTKLEQPEFIGRGPITAAPNRGRWPVNLQKQYLDTYQATFDPWFLAAAHAIAEMHLHRWKTEAWEGHPWSTGPIDFYRATHAPGHAPFLESFARHLHDWQHLGWANDGATLLPAAAIGWELTGDPLFLRRALGLLEAIRQSTYSAPEPPYYRGYHAMQEGNLDMLFTSFYHQWYPYLASLRKAGAGLAPIPPAFTQTVTPGTRIFFKKTTEREIELRAALPHTLSGPDGAPATTLPSSSTGKGARLPASAPAGLYTITFTEAGSLLLPITPPDTPEVIHFGPPGSAIPPASGWVHYTFELPPEASQLRLQFDFTPTARQAVRQLGIWDHQGEPVWSHGHSVRQTGKKRLEETLSLQPREEAKLWRLSLPGVGNTRVTLDPALPPYLSVSPDRWFLPEP